MTAAGTEARSPRSGAGAPLLIIGATAIGGGAGYVLTIFAASRLGAAGYPAFAVFWSSLYLVIAALSGIQQEVTRASREALPAAREPVARNFALVAALAVALALAASSLLWAPVVFPHGGWWLVVPLAFGAASYVLTAVTAGVLYGLRLWPFIAAMVAVDGVLRLILTGAALLVTDDLAVIAWAVVLPFLITPALLWAAGRRRMIGRFELDVGYGQLTANVARTVAGSIAAGVLISGFPVLLSATSPPASLSALAALIFAINLARAPLIIVVLALQSYFVVTLQKAAARFGRIVLLLLAAIVLGTAVVSALAAVVGPWALGTFFGAGFVLDGGTLAVVVASGGAVGMLCVTGAAVLARSRHTLYSVGWITAAVVTIALLLAQFPHHELVALAGAPFAGLAVHLLGLLAGRRAADAATVS